MKTVFLIACIHISVEAPYNLKVTDEYTFYLEGAKEPCMSEEFLRPACSQESNVSEEKKLCFVQPLDGQGVLCRQNEPRDFYEIRMVEDNAFPPMEGQVLFQNEMNLYLEKKNGETLHFFRIPMTWQAAAWCETIGKNSLTIHYRPEMRAYFENAFGCFNAGAFENILYIFRKFLFHCSYVDVGGEAVLFSAHSGGGKTTHALLWEHCGFGEMINGDRAVLERVKHDELDEIERKQAGTEEDGNCEGGHKLKYVVHGLPIAGSSNVFKNRSLPLRAIFMLEKAPVNEVVEISPAKKFLLVIEQITIHTWDKEFVSAATDFVADLIQNVPVKLLRCRPDEGAVQAVRETLSDDF